MTHTKHFVIIVPGLGDDATKLKFATLHWRHFGLEPIIHSVGWKDDKQDFQIKITRLLGVIDSLDPKRNKVSLIGCSAGGSAVLNAFYERRDVLNKVINVCGRLRTGSLTGFRSFKSKTASSPAFAQSIKLFETREPLLSQQDREKVMTVRELFGDELVPADTTTLEGAYNTTVPTGEHIFSIAMAMTIFSNRLINFLA
jgi:pimeloyl-ACP methyl ester carboxylesterase